MLASKGLWLAGLALAAEAIVAPAAAFTISGTLRNPSSQPVANADVKLFDHNGNPIGIPLVTTNVAGFYTINNIPNDQYLVGFEPDPSTHLRPAQVQARVQDANLTVNATLSTGVLLSGHVQNAAGMPLAGIDLNVTDTNGDLLYTPRDNTDAAGFYSLVLPAATVTIRWRQVTPSNPALLDVVRTETFGADRVIDITMTVGITVSGTVRNASGAPLANITVDFLDPVTLQKFTT